MGAEKSRLYLFPTVRTFSLRTALKQQFVDLGVPEDWYGSERRCSATTYYSANIFSFIHYPSVVPGVVLLGGG
jgi:hypothetical protein